MVSADTSRGPDEQYTFGSQSVEQSGGAIRAAAQRRADFLAAAARRFGVRAEELQVKMARSLRPDGRRATLWELAKESAGLLKGISHSRGAEEAGDYAISASRSTASICPAS